MLNPTSPAVLKTTRRRFVSSSIATMVAVGIAPALLGAEDKSGAKPVIFEAGDLKYECQHDWGQLPKHISYGNTHGVVEDSQGRIYVHHTVNKSSESRDAMVIFDHDGKFIESWGKEFRGGAHGLHINKEGSEEFLYLCDTGRSLVVKTNLKGEVVWQAGYPSESPVYGKNKDKKIRWVPTNLALAPNGDVYVGDGYGSSYINQYDKAGKFIRTLCTPGGGKGQLNSPHGIMCDTRGEKPLLMVADRGNNRIQYLNMDGEHVSFIKDDSVRMPCHFHEHKGLVIMPDLKSRVTLFDKNNKAIGQFGDGKDFAALRGKPRDKFINGQFIAPHGACFDHEGNIYVVEWVEVGRVTKLKKLA